MHRINYHDYFPFFGLVLNQIEYFAYCDYCEYALE
jgi:hypothetical protein